MDLHLKSIVILLALSCVCRGKLLGCDQGWDASGSNCYMFVTDKKVTYKQAENECNKYDSSLLYITSQTEYDWYTNRVKTFPSAAYWTSLNDIANSGNVNAPGTTWWKWGQNTLANVTLLRWNQSPANDGIATCGGVNIMGKMADVDCNSKQGYICNIELAAAGGGCPLGWLPTDTDCYYVSNTTDTSQLMTWSQAKNKCVALNSGSHLITIDDVHDQSFLSAQLPYLAQNTYLHWTGLQYQNKAWQWFNGATFSQSLFSWVSEPDGVALMENCGVIRYNGAFSDRGCNMQYNFVCKKPQSSDDNTLSNGCGIWLRAGQKCYMFYGHPQSTWSQAQAMCSSLNGNLMNIKDLDTNTWLVDQMYDPATWAYWIALNDISNEGSYVWSDGSSLNPNTITWNQEPNGYNGKEDCGNIYPNGHYNDQGCQRGAAPLCELDNVAACPPAKNGAMWVTRNADSGGQYNCYLFGNYSSTSVLMTNAEARSYCAGLATSPNSIPTLLQVDTQQEKTFIEGQLKGFRDNNYGYWTLLTDKGMKGYWSWDGQKMVDWTLVPWDKEPNTDTADTDCGMVMYGAGIMIRKCGNKLGFICERPANLMHNTGTTVSMKSIVPVLIMVIYSIL